MFCNSLCSSLIFIVSGKRSRWDQSGAGDETPGATPSKKKASSWDQEEVSKKPSVGVIVNSCGAHVSIGRG